MPYLSRRSFLQQLAAGATIAPWVTTGLRAQSPNSIIHHASMGAAGMAMADLNGFNGHKALKIVAACDVDEKRTAEFRKKWPEARVYADYRELLAKETDLQSVNVSTPDHMHAPIGMAALQRGLAVYGQKPLTHDIYESRRLTEVARERKLVTQMGIQIHSNKEYRTAVELIQSGAIGKVKEVHTFCAKGWGDFGEMPAGSDPVPEGLNWDLWLGVCDERPFIGKNWYHPSNWRKRLDFGTGTFGDMGCHVFDPVFSALALTAPISVRSEGAAPSAHSWALDAEIHYVFPGTAYTEGKTIPVYWYDGSKKAPEAIMAAGIDPDETDEKKKKVPDIGSIFIGTEGVMVLPHVGMPRLIGAKLKKADIKAVEGTSHWHQYLDAIGGNGKTSAGFDYSGPLTESILLGSVATRFPKKELAWDAKALQFTNTPEANALVKRPYRKGWETKGLS
jgi:predicted dehydrogenase